MPIPSREDSLKPLNIEQPKGVNFRVDDHEIAWDHWRFRYSFHPREGLVLYSVGYRDGAKLRPIMYRASLAEMVVPYGDPSPAWYFRNAFDISEYAFTGRAMYPMTLGADVPGNASFLDADFADEEGRAYNIPRAAALTNAMAASCGAMPTFRPASPLRAAAATWCSRHLCPRLLMNTVSTGSFIRTGGSRWWSRSPAS